MAEKDLGALHSWSGFYEMLCQRRGFQQRLIEAESIVLNKDERNIRKKFSDYRAAREIARTPRPPIESEN